MTPVTCRVSHKPPTSYGDCLRACIASIMDMDAEQVPHFADGGVDIETAWSALRAWLVTQGHSLFISSYPPEPLDKLLDALGHDNPECYYVLFGDTVDGGSHCVVGHGGKIVHNPAWVGCSLTSPALVGEQRCWPVWVIARG